MDLHSKMTMYITSTMTSPVTKTAKTSKWLRLKILLEPVCCKKRLTIVPDQLLRQQKPLNGLGLRYLLQVKGFVICFYLG